MVPATEKLFASTEFLKGRYDVFVDQLIACQPYSGYCVHRGPRGLLRGPRAAVRAANQALGDLAVARERLALRLGAQRRLIERRLAEHSTRQAP